MKILFISLLLAVLFIAACSSSDTSVPTPSSAPVVQPSAPALVSGDQKCTVTQDGATSMMYLSGGKVQRVDVVHPTQGQTHMLYQGDSVYQWMDGASQGMRFSLSQMQQMNARMQQMVADMEAEQGGSYVASTPAGSAPDCQPFSMSASLLQLPSGVNFVSPPTTQQIEGINSQAEAEAFVAQMREQYGQ